MKPRTRVSSISLLLCVTTLLLAAFVVPAITPEQVAARTRLESTQPLAGDPDVTDSPSPGPGKATKTTRAISPSSTTMMGPTERASIHTIWAAWRAYVRVLGRL